MHRSIEVQSGPICVSLRLPNQPPVQRQNLAVAGTRQYRPRVALRSPLRISLHLQSRAKFKTIATIPSPSSNQKTAGSSFRGSSLRIYLVQILGVIPQQERAAGARRQHLAVAIADLAASRAPAGGGVPGSGAARSAPPCDRVVRSSRARAASVSSPATERNSGGDPRAGEHGGTGENGAMVRN